jgi:LL-diaminopimelate aminotransferase
MLFGVAGEGYVRISLIAECDRLAEALRRFKEARILYRPEALVTGSE